MKTIVLIALLLACTMGVSVRRPMSNAQIQKFEGLKKGNQWASILMNLAELHTQAEGPLDDLVDAIEEVVADLERKTDRAHQEYDRQEAQHEAEVQRINGQINSANADISATTEFINNVLLVQERALEEDIANLQESIANTQQYIVDQTSLRNQQRVKFNQIIVEHEEGLAAVYEALDVLAELDGGAVSLLQKKKKQIKKSLDNVSQKVRKNVHATMINALLELTAGEFADSSALERVRELLNDVANNLTGSIAQFTQEENDAQTAFEADVAAKEAEINRMSIELTEKSEQLEQTKQSIEDNREFLAQRQRDLAGFQQDLEDENANFDHITQLYEELIAQLTNEQRACAEALDVLNSSDIAGYIGNRMSQDVIIDQPHGTGITVESNPFDLE